MTHLPPIGNIFFHTVSVCIQHLICSRKNDNTELNLKNFASAIRKKKKNQYMEILKILGLFLSRYM